MTSQGRPTSYKPEYDEQARKLCLMGATDADLARFFEVTEQTINNWKNAHVSFFESVKDSKEQMDSQVVNSLFKRATGYSHPEDKIFIHEGNEIRIPTTKHYPPDTQACKFWLMNRQRELWRDKREHEVTGKDDGPIRVVNVVGRSKGGDDDE